MTFNLLDSVTLSSSASSVTFSSIDQSYRDLVLVINAIGSSGNLQLRFNADSSLIYSYVQMYGTGSSATSNSGSSQSQSTIGVSATNGTVTTAQLMDYSATDKHKTILVRANDIYTWAQAHRYASTSAITQIEVLGSTYSAGSTFYLYGVAA